MKYGETFFDIAYLVIAIGIGIYLLSTAKNKSQKLMGGAALILGCGDAFHLVPRGMNYFFDADFTAALGVGKPAARIAMIALALAMVVQTVAGRLVYRALEKKY